jgi:hypothetical protein
MFNLNTTKINYSERKYSRKLYSKFLLPFNCSTLKRNSEAESNIGGIQGGVLSGHIMTSFISINVTSVALTLSHH